MPLASRVLSNCPALGSRDLQVGNYSLPQQITGPQPQARFWGRRPSALNYWWLQTLALDSEWTPSMRFKFMLA